jgi:hypothetical protein
MASLRDTLTALLNLQQVDRQIQRAKKAQAGLDNGSTAAAESTAARSAYEAKNDGYHRASGELKDCELKLATLEQKLKVYEQKLYQGTVTNPKELANIEKEIAALGRQRSDLDGRILELMDEVDQKKTDAELAHAEANAKDAGRQAAVEQFRAEYDRYNQEIESLMRERADAQALVNDPPLLKRYDEIRAKSGGVGIVQITNQNCGGCNMTLPTAQIKAVKDAEEVQTCENCRRILAP